MTGDLLVGVVVRLLEGVARTGVAAFLGAVDVGEDLAEVRREHAVGLVAVLGVADRSGRRLDRGRPDQAGGGAPRCSGVRLLLDELAQDDGDVVRCSAVERETYQAVDSLFDRSVRQGLAEVGGVDDVAEPVAAQQVAVTEPRLEHEHDRLNVAAAVECLHDHVALGVVLGLLAGDPAGIDEGLDERLVLGELVELAVAEAVGPGVADLRDREALAVPQHRGEGAAHAE